MIQMLTHHILPPLLVTLFLEILVAIIWGVREKREIMQVILVNCITNPLVNLMLFLSGMFFPYSMVRIILLVMEGLVFLVEGWLFHKLLTTMKHPYCFSGCLNCISFFIGGILLRIL